jgi:IS5 family transposase
MKQRTLAMMTGFEQYTKKTRRTIPLEEMEQVVPWRELCALVEPRYPKPGKGRPPVGVERMLRIYFLQQWFNLSDPAVEEALYDSAVMRQFVGIDLGCEPVPDETTVCKFRHLLEEHQLGELLFGKVNLHLQAKGYESRPARLWTRPSCTHPLRPRTSNSSAIRRCTKPRRANNGTSG